MEIRFSPHVTISQHQLAPKHQQICDNELPIATQQNTNFYSIQYLPVTLSFKSLWQRATLTPLKNNQEPLSLIDCERLLRCQISGIDTSTDLQITD